MSSKKVCNYRVFCETEQAYVYKWDLHPPTTCPNNNTHTIDANSITIIDSVANNDVVISSKDYTTTNGFYRMEGFVFDLPASQQNVYKDFSFTFPIVLYGMRFNTDIDHVGDSIDIIAAPGTIVGVLVAPANIGDTTLYVNNTVVENVVPGFYIILNNGVNQQECMVLNVNKDNSTITIACTLEYSFTPMTYVAINIYVARNFRINNPNAYKIGYGTFGGKPIPSNTTIRIVYKNNNIVQNKVFAFNIEYTY